MACTGEPSAEKTAQLAYFIPQHQLSWERLNTLASQHRITPFLYRALRDVSTCPDSFLSTLQQECQAIATDTMLKLHEYKRVTTLLTGHGIRHITFKGIYLAEHSYPESSLRPIGDMDIMVEANDLYKTIRILAPDGYELSAKYQPYLQQAAQVMVDELYEISLFRPFYATSRFDIDLHWRVDFLLREIGSFQLGDIYSPATHSVENQVILLVVHHGVNNAWGRISYINDLYFLLRSTTIDWPWLLEKLKLHKLDITFFAGLHWCQQCWKFPVPSSVQASMPANQLRLLAKGHEKTWDIQSAYSFKNMVLHFANAQTLVADKLTICKVYSRDYIFRASSINIKNRQIFIPKEWGLATVVIRALWALRRRR